MASKLRPSAIGGHESSSPKPPSKSSTPRAAMLLHPTSDGATSSMSGVHVFNSLDKISACLSHETVAVFLANNPFLVPSPSVKHSTLASKRVVVVVVLTVVVETVVVVLETVDVVLVMLVVVDVAEVVVVEMVVVVVVEIVVVVPVVVVPVVVVPVVVVPVVVVVVIDVVVELTLVVVLLAEVVVLVPVVVVVIEVVVIEVVVIDVVVAVVVVLERVVVVLLTDVVVELTVVVVVVVTVVVVLLTVVLVSVVVNVQVVNPPRVKASSMALMVSAPAEHFPDESSMASSSPSQNTVTSVPSGPPNSVAAALNTAATALHPTSTVKTSSTSNFSMSLHVTGSLPDKSCAGSRLGAQVASRVLSAVACPAHAPIGSDSA